MYRWIGCCVCVCVCKFTCMHGNLHIYLYSSCSQMWGLPFLKGQFHFSYNLPDLTRNKWDQFSSIIQDCFPGSTAEESNYIATVWPPAELTDPWPRHPRAPPVSATEPRHSEPQLAPAVATVSWWGNHAGLCLPPFTAGSVPLHQGLDSLQLLLCFCYRNPTSTRVKIIIYPFLKYHYLMLFHC